MTAIARHIGTNKRYVKAFLEQNNIPYTKYHQKGEQNARWKGGRIIDQDGYVLVKQFDHPRRDRHNYVREHRLVMEEMIGRYLEPGEVVHHKDGNKQNNAPENLELFGTNAEHLAETLVGQRPNWTPEGWARIKGQHGPRTNRPRTPTPE